MHRSIYIIDNLVERVSKYDDIKVVRIGHPAKVTDDVIPHTLDVLRCDRSSSIASVFKTEMDKLKLESRRSPDECHKNKVDKKIAVLNRAFTEAAKKSTADVVSSANVVFSTLSGYVNSCQSTSAWAVT
jgi:hypothetical protein